MGRSHWGAGADLIQTPGFGDIPVRVLEALCVLRAVLHLHFGGSQLIANAFPDSQLECSSLLSASSPAPHLRLRECHITTVPAWSHPLLHNTFGFSLQFSQASVIRSYTKFVMGVCRQVPCPFPSSCHLWAESSCSGGTGWSVLDIPYPRITLLTCKSWK